MLRHGWAGCLVLLLCVAPAAVAQYPDGGTGAGGGYSGGGYGGMRRGHGMMGMGRHGMRPLDPVVVDGPPAPADFARITSIADTQPYARLYRNFMALTKPQRDSLAAARNGMRDAFGSGDRDAMRGQMPVLKSLGDELSERQKTFDDTVKGMIGKDEWKKYQDWREDQRKEAESRRRGDAS